MSRRRTTRTVRGSRADRAARGEDDTAETGSPSIDEIAALTGRLRHLRGADATERAVFLADKHALLARCDHGDGDLL